MPKTTYTNYALIKAPLDNWSLPLRSVRLELLDVNQEPMNCVATGFLFLIGGDAHLITCWHVLTGYNLKELEIAGPPTRRYVKITCKKTTTSGSHTSIGDAQSWIVPLYTTNGLPAWKQENCSKSQPDLDAIGLQVPLQCDVAALPIGLSQQQKRFLAMERNNYPSPQPLRGGDDVLIVGYPYGYSALGAASPEPIFVRRAIAAEVSTQPFEKLLDGIGARGMSGSPVYRKEDEIYALVGIYTGAVHPDYLLSETQNRYDIFCSLGTMVDWTGLQVAGLT